MPIMQWLVRWAAMLLSRYRVGRDSQTPYERQKGKACDLEVVPFGETVWFKTLSESVGRKKAMESKWREGVWLGHSRNTSEALIGTRERVVRAWTVRRRVEDEKWNADMVTSMKGSPQRWSEEEPGDDKTIEVTLEAPDEEEPEELPKIKGAGRKSVCLKRQLS